MNAIAGGTPRPGIIVHDSTTDTFKGSVNAGTFSEFGGGSGGSGGGGKNYFANPSFTTTNGVTTYDDGGAYVDGAGTAASNVVAVITTTPGEILEGGSTLSITKSAGDASGQGLTLTTQDIDPIDQGGVLYGSFAWDGTDASFPAGDIELFAYDVDGAAILPVEMDGFENKLLPKTRGIIRFRVFTESVTTGTVRISLHIETDNLTGSFYEVFVDELKIGPQEQITVMPYQDWSDYTPATAGLGTVTINRALWRRIGDSAEIQVRLTTGTTAASELQIGLPNGITVDSGMSAEVVGVVHRNAAVETNHVALATAGDSYLNVGYVNASFAALLSPQNGSSIFGNTETLTLNAVVPISGWQSSAVLGANQKTFRGTDLNWTQVSVAPAALGEYRALTRVVSSVTFANDATAAPFTQADGWRIYSVNGTSAGTAGQPNRYEFYIGKNRSVLPIYKSSAGLTGWMLTDLEFETTNERGLKFDYDASTGLALVTLPLTATGTTNRSVGYGVASGTSASNSQTDCYFDFVAGESPANLLIEYTSWIDAGTITIGATTTGPTKGSSIVIDKVGYQINNNKLDASYQYIQSNNTAAAAGTGTYLYSLPSGIEFDPTFINPDSSFADASVVGHGYVANNGTTVGTSLVARAYSTTQFFLDGDNGTTAMFKVGDGYFAMNQAAGHRFGVTISCPVIRV